jgi:pimeloyl-ACP methyl ester carboxylesterase
MPLISANGLKLNVQQLGEAGPPVIMVHGLMLGTLSSWYFSIAPALAQSHRVFMYDLRCHGFSERVSEGFTLAQMAADLDAVVNFSGGKPVVLIGHSFGGAIALRYASMHSGMVRKLVIVESPIPAISKEVDLIRWAKSKRDRAATSRGEDLILEMSEDDKQLAFGGLPPVVRDALLRNGKRPNRLLAQILHLVGNTSMLDDVMREPEFTAEEIARVTCPVLLCYGEGSGMRPGPDHVLMTALPDVRLRLLKGGHSLPIEAPEELLAAIGPFLSEANVGC